MKSESKTEVQLNVRINPDIYKDLHSFSFHENLTKKVIVEQALSLYFQIAKREGIFPKEDK